MNIIKSSNFSNLLRKIKGLFFGIMAGLALFFPLQLEASRVDFDASITNGNIVTDSFEIIPLSIPGMFVTTEFINDAEVTLVLNPTTYPVAMGGNIESVDLFIYNSTGAQWSQLMVEFSGINPDYFFPGAGGLLPRLNSPHEGSYSLSDSTYLVDYIYNDFDSHIFSFKIGGGLYQFPELQETPFEINIKPISVGFGSPVPLPTAIWLYATGLLGFIVSRRNKD